LNYSFILTLILSI
jgi:hypothetical protein